MKKIIAAALAFSLVLAVKAQEIPERKTGRPGMHERHKRHHGMDMKQLNLTDAQKEQFKKEKENFRKELGELKKNENITVKEWKSRMESLRKSHKSTVDGILTPEQKGQLEKMKAEGKARQEGMIKKRGEEMKTRLGLTDDQSAKLEKSRKETGEKIKAIRDNKSLPDEKKREEIKEIMKGQKEAMKSILTKEQLEKMKEERKHKPGMYHKKTEKKETAI
ncbi:MAG: hypothetical protein ACT4OJ_09765 [Bacteroidota bacterium]